MSIRTETVIALPTWDHLRDYIHRELCQFDGLEISQTPLFQTTVQQGKKSPAILFHIEGPRLLRTSAVWSADESRILFYDSTGQRIRTMRLSESPESTTAKAA
ncbi:MAG: hypothetical protein ACRC8S_16905 [Fimbriiglobus sp.]